LNPHDQVRLRHIADAFDAALLFAGGRTRADLDNDAMLLYALVHAMMIAGEAASKITSETRGLLPDLPWASLTGMRNRLVHAYFDIDRDILWNTITEAVPPLLTQLRTVLQRT
jgi:uncharacterized protein with HEPN domain